MKRNAILIAVILFAAGSAGSHAQSDTGSRTDQDSTYHSGAQIESDSQVEGGELFERDSLGQIETPTPLDPPTALEHDPAFVEDDDAGLDSEGELIVNDEDKEVALEDNDDLMADEYDLDEHAVGGPAQSVSGSGSSGTIRADSSIRGGSDRARGYDRSGNEYELSTDELDPSVQADSSIRGGSDRARGPYKFDAPAEPGDARANERRFKADSSIRGGSDRARGWDLRRSDSETLRALPDYSVQSDSAGSSATLESGSDISSEQDMDISGTYDNANSETDISDLEKLMNTKFVPNTDASGAPPELESGIDSSSESDLDLSDPEPYSGTLDDAHPEASTTDTDIEIESSISESEDQSSLERQYHNPDESTLDDGDPDASGSSATSESGTESSDDNTSGTSVDPEIGASDLGRYSIQGGNEGRSTDYDTESHADVATELEGDVPSGRESYDRSDEDLSITIDNDAAVTRDGIGSPGSSQSESATSDESDDSDVNAGIQFDSTGDVQAEDPYHPTSRRSEFEASGGLEGVESESSEGSMPSEEAESYQPDFEADASLRSDSHEDSDSIVTDSDLPQSQVGAFPGEPDERFRSNPAHGVGGPAPFQHGRNLEERRDELPRFKD